MEGDKACCNLLLLKENVSKKAEEILNKRNIIFQQISNERLNMIWLKREIEEKENESISKCIIEYMLPILFCQEEIFSIVSDGHDWFKEIKW